MILRRLLGVGALLVALVLAASAVQAAPGPEAGPVALAQVPDAPVVIKIHGIERTKDRLLAMLKVALPDQHALVKDLVENYLKNLPEGRKLNGLDKDAPVFVVLTELPEPGGEPKVAIMVGVTKYQEFRDGVLLDDERKDLKPNKDGYESTTVNDRPMYWVDRSKDGYAVIANDKDLAIKLTKKPEKGLDKRLSADLAKKMTAADLALYVDMMAVNKKYGDAIKAAKEQAEAAIEAGGAADKTTQELAKKMIAPMFQAVQDVETFLATVEFRPEGLNVALHGEVDAKSKTNNLLMDAKPGAVAAMEKLPAGFMMYNALQIRPALLKEFGGFLFGALAAGDKKDDPSVKAMKETLDLLAAAKPTLQVGATDLPARGLSVLVAEDPAKAVEATLKLYQSLKAGGTFGTTPIKGDPVVKTKVEKYQGIELNYVSVKWDLEKMAEAQGNNPAFPDKDKAVEYLKNTVGDGQSFWLGSDGKVMLTVTAKDLADAKTLIDRYQKGDKVIGSVEAFKEARKQMPADTTVLSLIDVPLYAEAMTKAMKPLFDGLGVNLPPGFGTPAVKGESAFMGFALTMQPQRGSVDLFVSAKSVNELYKMYFKGLLGGQ